MPEMPKQWIEKFYALGLKGQVIEGIGSVGQ